MSSKGFITAERIHHRMQIFDTEGTDKEYEFESKKEFLSREEFEKRKGTLLKYLHEIDVFINTDEFREIYKILDGEKE